MMFLLDILRCGTVSTHNGCQMCCSVCNLTKHLFSLQEFRKIRDFKKEKSGRESGDLEPWDEAYYTALMKSSTYNLDSSVSLALLFVLHVI